MAPADRDCTGGRYDVVLFPGSEFYEADCTLPVDDTTLCLQLVEFAERAAGESRNEQSEETG